MKKTKVFINKRRNYTRAQITWHLVELEKNESTNQMAQISYDVAMPSNFWKLSAKYTKIFDEFGDVWKSSGAKLFGP